jgi:hypothetical protein
MLIPTQPSMRNAVRMITRQATRRETRVRTRRAIGRWGTVARLIVGVCLLADVAFGHIARGFHPAAWALGLVGFPTVLLVAQWTRTRRSHTPLRATGPAGHAANAAVFLALYATPWHAPALSVTSDAALIFYGASMLLAAARGYSGCEVLAVSNWLLRRDDQVGCLLFAPLDHAERAAPPGDS